ncbi:MAG: PIN domain-containing protein, partial [Acidobacteriota bacterium]|nr:PIN domain-containing protein [Acidobacteriota bacterium]
FQGDPGKLTGPAIAKLEESDLLVSPMVVLELEYLFELRRILLRPQDLLFKLEAQIGVTVCDFPFPAIVAAAIGENWTRDPFDRLIVAHAKANSQAALLSSDQVIRKNYSEAVW